jgi:hypothetical protein
MISRAAVYLFVCTLLGGCANLAPLVPAGSTPEADAGYVAGTFARWNEFAFAFVLKNTRTGAELTMPLGPDAGLPYPMRETVAVIKVPPGTYVISQWLTYTPPGRVGLRSPITHPALAAEFAVPRSGVAYLGSFRMSSPIRGDRRMIEHRIEPVASSVRAAREAVLRDYPEFWGHSFACILCSIAPVGELRAGNTPPQPPTCTPPRRARSALPLVRTALADLREPLLSSRSLAW